MTLIPGYDDDVTLRRIGLNTMMMLRSLDKESGQQMIGLSPPREGYGEGDAIMFTGETVSILHAYLRSKGVLAVRVNTTGHPSASGWSLIFANSVEGLKSLIAKGRKEVARAAFTRRGLMMTVVDDPDTLGTTHH